MSQNTPEIEEAKFIWKQLMKLLSVSPLYLDDDDLPGQTGGQIFELQADTNNGYRMHVKNLSGGGQWIVYTEFDVINSEVVERDGKNFLVMDFKKAMQSAREYDDLNEAQDSMLYDLVQKHLAKGGAVSLMGRYWPQPIAAIRTRVEPPEEGEQAFYPIMFKDGGIYTMDEHEFDELEIDFDGGTMLLVPPALKKIKEGADDTPMPIMLAKRHLDKGQRLYLTWKLGQHTDIHKVTDVNMSDGKVEFFLHEPAMWVKVSATEAEHINLDFDEDRMILTPASVRNAGSSTRVVAPVKEDISDPMLFDLVQKWLKEQKPVFLRAADGEFAIRRVEKIGREGDMGLYRFDTWQRAWRCNSDTLERCIVDTRKDGTRVVVTPGALRESMEEGILMHLMKKHTKNHSLLVIRRSKSDPWSNMDIYVDKFFQDSDTAFRVVDAETGEVESFDLANVAPFNHAAKDQMEYELKQNIAADDGKVWLKVTFNLQ